MSDRGDPGGREIPRGTWSRGAKLLGLPLGAAGRATVGAGRRLLGADAADLDAELRRQAATQLFDVLGELKGGAMKVGQALSLYEAMLPEDIAGPFRERLAHLQDGAPPLPASRVEAVLRQELGTDWRRQFSEFDRRPAAAASIGQVHRARLADGTRVAVKIQYPGADQALASDLRQLRRLAAVAAPLMGGVDISALTEEIALRVFEEVDYRLEGQAQQQAAEGFAGHPRFLVPRVQLATERVLVSDWVEGDKLSSLATAPDDVRNRVGLDYVSFLFAGPAIAGLLHGDPHPGNYLITPDGRLGVVDFGLVARLPDGLPPAMGRLIALAVAGCAEEVAVGLTEEGFVTRDLEPAELLGYLAPFIEPASVPEFHFTRDWMRAQYTRVMASTGRDGIAMKLNIPATYALIYRVWLGGIAVLAQLDVRAGFAGVLDTYLPGFEA